MKIVIVGAGRVGYAIAEQLLTEGHDITVVESDPERAAYISSTLDVIVVEGRANVDQLRIANVADADLLIAATTSDETNLISCMVGRKLGATHTIARVRDEEYYQDVALLQDELGLSLSINPERTSAKEISRTLRFPAATKVEPFANGLVELVEFKLREGSKLDGLRLNDFRGRYSDGILICAVEREGSVTIPNGDFVLAAGDYVTVVGAPHELHELFRKIGEFRHEAESVIIIGGGRIAERLALELARMHIHSTIIERDPARCRVMKTLLPEATIICADGTKPDVLREEGLPEADALVTLTESDETNLIISSFAYHEQVPKIVTKVDEDNFIELAESYGLTTIIQPADVTPAASWSTSAGCRTPRTAAAWRRCAWWPTGRPRRWNSSCAPRASFSMCRSRRSSSRTPCSSPRSSAAASAASRPATTPSSSATAWSSSLPTMVCMS